MTFVCEDCPKQFSVEGPCAMPVLAMAILGIRCEDCLKKVYGKEEQGVYVA